MIYTILGLLMIKCLTIYEISKTLKGKISPFYSGSYGSIQSAIKKLLNEGSIVYEEQINNGRNNKIYSITNIGKENFMSWLESDIPVFSKKDNTLNRLFFFGFLEKNKQIATLEKYIESLKERLIEFNEYEEEASNKKVSDSVKNIAIFQLKTLEYVIEQIKFDIKWFQKQINKLRRMNDES